MAKKNINKEDNAGKEKKTGKSKAGSSPNIKKHTKEKLSSDKANEVQSENFSTTKKVQDSHHKNILHPKKTDEKNKDAVLNQPVNGETGEKIQNEFEEILPEKMQEITPEIVDDLTSEKIDETIPEIVNDIPGEKPDEIIPEPVEEITTEPAEDKINEREPAEETTNEQENINKPEVVFPKSNYQISLINENLLRIVVETDKAVGVDCFVKSKKPDEDDLKQTQSNRILVHPKEEGKSQEVEIIVSINKKESTEKIDEQVHLFKTRTTEESLTDTTEESGEKQTKKFLIDPSVRDLVVDEAAKKEILEQYKPKTREEYYEEKLKPGKNKYAINRRIVEKNLKIGMVCSLIVLMFSMSIYSGITMTEETSEEQKTQRLIVIQDIPEMKVDIPLEEKKEDSGEDKPIVTPRINIRRNPIRTPRIEVTKKDTTLKSDSTEIAKNNEDLDKLRRGDSTSVGNSFSGINSTDTINTNVVSIPFDKYGWTLIDSLDYGGRKFKFSSDTSQVIKDPSEIGKVSDFKMFVIQDIKGTEFSCGKNLRDFPVRMAAYKAFKCEPREEIISNQIEYMYRISNSSNSYAVTIKVEYKKEYKPEYFAKVDSLIYYIYLPEIPE
ncbi:MAG: hypothetical protein JW917_05005 [Ignavibacteria bacterium]|nr:hypothetical protein [Ignavibacteria bacterium]